MFNQHLDDYTTPAQQAGVLYIGSDMEYPSDLLDVGSDIQLDTEKDVLQIGSDVNYDDGGDLLSIGTSAVFDTMNMFSSGSYFVLDTLVMLDVGTENIENNVGTVAVSSDSASVWPDRIGKLILSTSSLQS